MTVSPTAHRLSDDELVTRLPRRDEAALAELYDRYGGVAYGLALRVLRDGPLAEEAVQEAFLALWRAPERVLPERGSPGTWLLTVVHRRAVDIVRREERRRSDPLETVEVPDERGVEETVFARLERERVLAALAQLPALQREAIELAYFGGLTQRQLAQRLGVPLGTIKSRMFKGLERLAQLLEGASAPADTLDSRPLAGIWSPG